MPARDEAEAAALEEEEASAEEDPDAEPEMAEDEEDDGDDGEDGEGAGSGKVKGVKQTGITKKGDEKRRKQMWLRNKAQVTFPVHRVAKALKQGGYAKVIATAGTIYLTAVLEYVCAEILELAGNAATDQNKNRISPRHIQLAIRNDEELNKYMSQVSIMGGGVIPNIHSNLLPKKMGPKKSQES